jgi:hypothetical protein
VSKVRGQIAEVESTTPTASISPLQSDLSPLTSLCHTIAS